jgi:putative ABC transport system permease protein
VVGSAINTKEGGKLKFFDREYTVAARLERTGMGFDASVFMTIDSARVAAGDFVRLGGRFVAPASSISSILVRVSEGYSVEGVISSIQKTYGYGSSGIALVPTRAFVRNVAAGIDSLIFFIVALEVLIWCMAVLVLAAVFSVTINSRLAEFGLYRSLGAARTKLVALILTESGLLSVCGGLVGIFFAGLSVLPFRIYIGSVLKMPYIQAPMGRLAVIFAACLLLSFAVGPLASLIPAVRANRSDVHSVIRGT